MLTSKMTEPIESVKETLTGGTCLGIDHFEESLDLRKKCHVCCTQTKQFKRKKNLHRAVQHRNRDLIFRNNSLMIHLN